MALPTESGDIFHQPELAATLRKLVETERSALAAGKDRKAAIMAAYDRFFYRGDIAREIVRSMRELGGLFTLEDLSRWRVKLEARSRRPTRNRGVQAHALDAGPGDAANAESCSSSPTSGRWAKQRAVHHTLSTRR
jgi:gamma-glutamyltranspeptidase